MPALEGLHAVVMLFPMMRKTQTDTESIVRLQAGSGRRGGTNVRKLDW
jgi:hypothetical protein